MARYVSLTLRQELFKENSAEEVAIALATVTRPDLDTPVYLSSDPTQRLSTDPLKYGTRSNGITFEFLFMGAMIPDDQDGSPSAVSLVFEDLSGDIGTVLRGLQGLAQVELQVVRSSSPDDIEARYTNLLFGTASGKDSQVTLAVARKATSIEPWPPGRQTKARFPGLFL
jgi:hypothetical protein